MTLEERVSAVAEFGFTQRQARFLLPQVTSAMGEDEACGGFRPADGIVALRGYLRHRATLIESAGALVQRMQKALIQMNIQLPLVVSDITGVTGLRILRDIVDGHRDPRQLAQHRDCRCHASEARSWRP